MQSGNSKKNIFDPAVGFEIRDPLWTLGVCLSATIACVITFFNFRYLKTQDIITTDTFYIGYIFLAVSFCSAVGVYAWIREKLVYRRGTYKYCRAFGRSRTALIENIDSVKILTVHYWTKRGVKNKIRVIFFDKNKNILIKIIDDGTLSKNEIFIKSLKYNRIKIIREEKYDY